MPTSNKRDYYEVLGVERGAPAFVIPSGAKRSRGIPRYLFENNDPRCLDFARHDKSGLAGRWHGCFLLLLSLKSA